jgi:hypothetical protein
VHPVRWGAFTLAGEEAGALTYTSDEEPAKKSAASSEAMGIAGKWQNVGPLKLNITNSGPPGAAVSLRIQLPEGMTPEATAASLRRWGIDVGDH